MAAASGLGRSTVTKHLALLERAGHAHRNPGGQDGARKLPDRWTDIAAVGKPPTDPITAQAPEAAPGPITTAGHRLRPGQLDTLVLDHLHTTVSPGPHAPAAVAKALGRSSGAVANCLTRLAATGRLQQVSDRPRRYDLSPARS
ncbi:hypothetical protein NBH00_18525 [Paraconexibacter antarcticus]|uniref:MarR family transcriptional regulator n=1 Tax=Paraconexibacter antarcticus TaxID=2949664 RepID=A0ABY5DMU9_9ACTN|nr:hypothetical protein [Paraconexibacter antarcticus]UTI63338.1 hypothetical protein NBH00_18525 [Paraconexibacter antarcticus]